MGSVNLYKIDNEKQQMFFQELARKMDNIDTIFWKDKMSIKNL